MRKTVRPAVDRDSDELAAPVSRADIGLGDACPDTSPGWLISVCGLDMNDIIEHPVCMILDTPRGDGLHSSQGRKNEHL